MFDVYQFYRGPTIVPIKCDEPVETSPMNFKPKAVINLECKFVWKFIIFSTFD